MDKLFSPRTRRAQLILLMTDGNAGEQIDRAPEGATGCPPQRCHVAQAGLRAYEWFLRTWQIAFPRHVRCDGRTIDARSGWMICRNSITVAGAALDSFRRVDPRTSPASRFTPQS